MFHLVCPKTLKPGGKGLEVTQLTVAEDRLNQGKRRDTCKEQTLGGSAEGGGGIGWGDHFIPHKIIERSFQHCAN